MLLRSRLASSAPLVDAAEQVLSCTGKVCTDVCTFCGAGPSADADLTVASGAAARAAEASAVPSASSKRSGARTTPGDASDSGGFSIERAALPSLLEPDAVLAWLHPTLSCRPVPTALLDVS
jgi:hypothetical protein